jgi:hypothetical protein
MEGVQASSTLNHGVLQRDHGVASTPTDGEEHMRVRNRRLVVGLLAGALALVPATSAAAATASPKVSATITVGNLIMEPTSRGYVGTLAASVKWNGPDNGWLSLYVVEPVAGAWQSMANGDGCTWFYAADGRHANTCIVSGLHPGEVRDVTQSFRVLTTPRPYAMSEPSADIWAQQIDTTISKTKHYSTTFRGTDGSLSNPLTYVGDKLSDASLAVGSAPVAMVRQADGSFLGRLPVTVTWNGDAPHWYVWIDAALPNDWFVWDTDPTRGFGCPGGCEVPGPNGTGLMQGEGVSFDLIIYAPEGTAPGTYSGITTHIAAHWAISELTNDTGELTDVSPADNSGTFTAQV